MKISNRPKATLREAFATHAHPGNPSECWEWAGFVNSKGYGAVNFRDKLYLAHRLSYEFNRGSIPVGIQVCHKCDNPKCVNPDHLFLGTNADNVADKIAKGRQPQGEKHTRAILTELQVKEIRQLKSLGYSAPELAPMYGVAATTISSIWSRQSWRHIE